MHKEYVKFVQYFYFYINILLKLEYFYIETPFREVI